MEVRKLYLLIIFAFCICYLRVFNVDPVLQEEYKDAKIPEYKPRTWNRVHEIRAFRMMQLPNG